MMLARKFSVAAARRAPLAVRRLSGAAAPQVPPEGALSLYSYAICPFCNKCKAAARYAEVPVHSIEVNPLTKAQIAFSKEHRKVPIAVKDDGTVLVESDAIVEDILKKGRETTKDFASEDAKRWAKWASEDLAVYVYPNITRSFAECRAALAYADQAFPFAEATLVKWVGAFGMSVAHGAIKKKYNMTDERAALSERLHIWQTQLLDGPFRGGRAEPDLADVAVFGVLGAVAGLPAHTEIMAAMPKLKAWYDAVDNALPAAKKAP